MSQTKKHKPQTESHSSNGKEQKNTSYEVLYFPGRGRAENIRLLFAESGVEFKYTRFTDEEWEAYKPKTPYGQLPCIKINDKILPQSYAIIRYLAKQFGLTLSDDFQDAMLDSFVEGARDVGEEHSRAFWASEGKQEKLDKFFSTTLPKYLDIWEKMLKENGGHYFVGDKFTYGDIFAYRLLSEYQLQKKDLLQKYPHLDKFVTSVADRPNIAAYLKKRPASEW